MLNVDVHKRHDGFVLDARFDMPTPGVVALFGRSGCGKSTLINIIAGLIDADSGRVRLDRELLLDTDRGIDVRPERRRIGYVFQDARLFPHLGVEANLRYAQKRASGSPFVGFDEAVDLLGLGPLLGRRTHQLSGGERQRTAIARALLTQPCLLLLDEPLASLDAERREEVLPYLENLRDRLSIPMVYVSHDFDEVLRLATYVVLMDRGRVTAQGSIGEMIMRPELRNIIGADAVGAILDGETMGQDTDAGLMRVRVGRGELKLRAGAPSNTVGYTGVTKAGRSNAHPRSAGPADAGPPNISHTGPGDWGTGDVGRDDAGLGKTGRDDAGLGDTGRGETDRDDAGLGDTGRGETGRDDAGLGDTDRGYRPVVNGTGYPTGRRVRIQILARDVIVATQPPQNLSVRNVLAGVITTVSDDGDEADLVSIDVGGAVVMARITKAARRELSLYAGMPAWALVKAVSLRGYSVARVAATPVPQDE